MSESNVLLLCDDLIFGSRISATARAQGADLRTVKTADAAVNAMQSRSPVCVIADLAVAGDRIGELMAAVLQLASRPTVVAFGSHVDTARLRAAMEAGCDIVLPRSKFVEDLEGELPRWLAPRNEGPDR